MNLPAQLEELNLIRFSLLPGELFVLCLPSDDAEDWSNLLESFAEGGLADGAIKPKPTCRFKIGLEDGHIRFEFELPMEYPGHEERLEPIVSVRGKDGVLEKDEQVRWQEIVKER